MIVNVPATWLDRQDVARRLLASARELGEDIRTIRWYRGGYDVPERVAIHAGLIEPDPGPEQERKPRRRKVKVEAEEAEE